MSSNAPIMVELVGENLLALLGEKDEKKGKEAGLLRATPPPLPVEVDGAGAEPPRLVADLNSIPAPVSAKMPSPWGGLQAARRPLFESPAKTEGVEAIAAPEAEATSNQPLKTDVKSDLKSDVRPEEPSESWSAEPQLLQQAATPAESGLMLYQAPPVHRRAMWMAVAGAAVVLSGFAGYSYTTYRMNAMRQTNGLAVVSPGAEVSAKYSPLRLQLESKDHALVGIRWDPNSEPVGKAASGRLVIIEESAEPRIVPLDAAQLKIGHLYYDASAERVQFRLEVTDDQGAVTSESLLAVAMPKPRRDDEDKQNARNANVKAPVKISQSNFSPTSAPATRLAGHEAGHEGDALRASHSEGEDVSGGLSVLARLPQTFNHFAPGPEKSSIDPNVLHQVAAVYPASARAAHVSGTVRFTAIVGTDGKIRNLLPISGPPMLIEAAADAAKQWVFKPKLQNGHPVEAVTQISVPFPAN